LDGDSAYCGGPSHLVITREWAPHVADGVLIILLRWLPGSHGADSLFRKHVGTDDRTQTVTELQNRDPDHAGSEGQSTGFPTWTWRIGDRLAKSGFRMGTLAGIETLSTLSSPKPKSRWHRSRDGRALLFGIPIFSNANDPAGQLVLAK